MSKLTAALKAAPPPPPKAAKLDGLDDEDKAEIVRLHVEMGYSPRRIALLLTENDFPVSEGAVINWLQRRGERRLR